MQLLPKEVAAIVKPYIARKAYYAHPENLLLAMMTDSNQVKRQKAVNTVLNIRAAKSSNWSVIREFKVPIIDFNASEWHEMIDWDNTAIEELPLSPHLTTEQ